MVYMVDKVDKADTEDMVLDKKLALIIRLLFHQE